MGIILSRPGIYTPENIITNSFLEKIIDTSDKWIIKRSGIKERRISLNKGIREMGSLAAKKLLDQELITDQKIDEIIFCIL